MGIENITNVLFLQTAKSAIEQAKKEGVLYYVYFWEDEYYTLPTWYEGWIFRVYPGGRKEFSVRGKRFFGL